MIKEKWEIESYVVMKRFIHYWMAFWLMVAIVLSLVIGLHMVFTHDMSLRPTFEVIGNAIGGLFGVWAVVTILFFIQDVRRGK